VHGHLRRGPRSVGYGRAEGRELDLHVVPAHGLAFEGGRDGDGDIDLGDAHLDAAHLDAGLHDTRVVEVPHQTLLESGFSPQEAKTVKIRKGKGCTVCNSTGYKGRTGLYEVMEIDDDIRELILVGASAVELKKKAIEHGMITLRRSGLIKVMDGSTTMEEVARETVH
jgi:hypothetical protein